MILKKWFNYSESSKKKIWKISVNSVTLLRMMCCITYQICAWQGWRTAWCVFAKVRRRFHVMVSLSDFKRLNSSAVKTASTTLNPGRKHFHKKLFSECLGPIVGRILDERMFSNFIYWCLISPHSCCYIPQNTQAESIWMFSNIFILL